MIARWLAVFAISAGVTGCLGDTPGGDDEPLGGARTVTGEVVDFQTNAAIQGPASLSTSGIVPSPSITVQGAGFTIDGVPDNSTFQILAAAPPSHRATFSPSIEVVSANVAGVTAPVVSEAFLGTLATEFGVTPSAANGVLLARLVDAAGAPRAGITDGDLVLAGASGPHFLDANLMPAPNANASSTSGWVVFFELPPGIVELAPAANAALTLEMPASPINAGAVTLATIVVRDGAPVMPVNVSFSRDIVPVFSARGCVACHSGGGPGKDLGGLKLDGGNNIIYTELVEEDPTRVVRTNPPASLVLTMPSRESPADTHPNITFASSVDPDYVKILVWIREGAKDN